MASKILPLSLVLALASGAVCQEVKPAAEKAEPVVQEPKKPAEIDRIDELTKQLERAKAELDATKQLLRSGGLPARVQPALHDRALAPRVHDLGIEVPEPPAADIFKPAQPPVAKRTGVRILTDEERGKLGDNVVFTVDGEPVTRQEFDAALSYFAARPNVAEEQAKKDTIRALVIQKSALARFKDGATAAREQMAEIEQMLKAGNDFADVARAHSQCPSAAQGGDLGTFGRGAMDPMFERAAFQTEVGKTSDVIQSAFGYHIVKVAAHERGDNEQVKASHILVMFDQDQGAIRRQYGDAASGRVDLAFATPELRALSPF